MQLGDICFRAAEEIRDELRTSDGKYDEHETELFQLLELLDGFSRLQFQEDADDEA